MPDHGEGLYNLGWSLHQLGVEVEAGEVLSRAVQSRPDSDVFHQALATALVTASVGGASAALPHYEAAAHLAPSTPAHHNNLGSCLLQLGRLDEARRHYAAALRLQPLYADSYLNLGYVAKIQY